MLILTLAEYVQAFLANVCAVSSAQLGRFHQATDFVDVAHASGTKIVVRGRAL